MGNECCSCDKSGTQEDEETSFTEGNRYVVAELESSLVDNNTNPDGKVLTVALTRATLKEELGLNLDFDETGRTILVSSIVPNKLVAKWNTTVSADKQVKKGDFLVELNGLRHKSGMQRELNNALELAMGFLRPEQYKVDVDQGGPLGLTFQKWDPSSELCESLVITRIDRNGPISSWNAVKKENNEPTAIVQVQDRIVEVNSKRGSSQLLLDEIKGSEKRALILSRCPRLPAIPTKTLKSKSGLKETFSPSAASDATTSGTKIVSEKTNEDQADPSTAA
jgi:hypothetical protein